MTESAIKAALSDFEAVWLTLWGEARGEPVEGVIAVGCVIRNRALYGAGRYGTGYKGVCLKRKQFSCWNPGPDPNHRALMAMAERVVSDHAVRSEIVADDVTRQIQYLAQGLMGGQLRDNTHGADHYLTTALFTRTPPTWARGQVPVAHKGAHAFLKLG